MCCGVAFLIAIVIAAGAGSMTTDIPGDGRNIYAVQGWEGTMKHDAMLSAMDSVVLEEQQQWSCSSSSGPEAAAVVLSKVQWCRRSSSSGPVATATAATVVL